MLDRQRGLECCQWIPTPVDPRQKEERQTHPAVGLEEAKVEWQRVQRRAINETAYRDESQGK